MRQTVLFALLLPLSAVTMSLHKSAPTSTVTAPQPQMCYTCEPPPDPPPDPTPTCASYQIDCDGDCCGVRNATASCTAGCSWTCNSGYHNCSGTCASNTSTQTCGTSCSPCPTTTNGYATCTGGVCGVACNTGYQLCGSSCLCGPSCATCAGDPNGSPTCVNGACSLNCNSGYTLVNGHCALDFTITINSPNVNSPVTDYTNITFQPGDRVYVTAGGCVQTGGTGSTWKQYVNPSGDNADRLYHGRIWIPGATMGLETLGSVINRSPVIVATPPPTANMGEMYLRLGYDDDDYSNNGYWGHDDGTENQCLGVGNAWVTLRIVRWGDGGATRTCPSYLNYNILIDPFWNALDANMLPLNPSWGEQCLQSSLVDIYGACGGAGAYVNSVHQPDPGCTTFLPTTDTKDALFGLCSSPYGVNGHLNWGLATYTGKSYWQEYDSGITGDDDFNLLLKTADDRGITVHNGTVPDHGYPNPDIGTRAIQLEFSAAETVHSGGNLTPDWYKMAYGSDTDRINLIDGRPAIAIGLLNMDMVHEIAAELHPVLGLAVQTKSPLLGNSEEEWLVMVRHSGDQGECSHSDVHYIHGFEGHDMRFTFTSMYGTPIVNGATTHFYNGYSSIPISLQQVGSQWLLERNPSVGGEQSALTRQP